MHTTGCRSEVAAERICTLDRQTERERSRHTHGHTAGQICKEGGGLACLSTATLLKAARSAPAITVRDSPCALADAAASSAVLATKGLHQHTESKDNQSALGTVEAQRAAEREALLHSHPRTAPRPSAAGLARSARTRPIHSPAAPPELKLNIPP